MIKALLFFTLFAVSILSAACGGSGSAIVSNANATVDTNANAANIKLDANSLPPEFSTSPIPPSANTTPGIPSAEELKKPFKAGPESTPGIPSPEELKRALKQQLKNTNMNTVPPGGKTPPSATNSDIPMMKKNLKQRPLASNTP